MLQQIGRTDARELQQLRRVVRAARHKHFLARLGHAQLPVLLVRDAAGALAVEQDALCQRRGLDAQIAARQRRPQIGPRRRGPPAAPRRGLEEARALLGRAIEIRIGRNADFGRGMHERFRQRIMVAPVRHRQRSAGAVIFVGAALLIFRLPEVRQHVVIAPAGIAALPPAVIVLVLAAHVEQAVDRAGTAEHFSPRLEHLPAVQTGLGLGLVHPVDGFFLEQLAVAERDMDPDVGVLRPGLEQQHRVLAVGAQAVGKHAAGRAGTDDDVIILGDVVRRRAMIVVVHWFPPAMRRGRQSCVPAQHWEER
jgi:hypothetical protein